MKFEVMLPRRIALRISSFISTLSGWPLWGSIIPCPWAIMFDMVARDSAWFISFSRALDRSLSYSFFSKSSSLILYQRFSFLRSSRRRCISPRSSFRFRRHNRAVFLFFISRYCVACRYFLIAISYCFVTFSILIRNFPTRTMSPSLYASSSSSPPRSLTC